MYIVFLNIFSVDLAFISMFMFRTRSRSWRRATSKRARSPRTARCDDTRYYNSSYRRKHSTFSQYNISTGETREQIQQLELKLTKLKEEKHQLFLQLKKVLNEDDNRKRQQFKDAKSVYVEIFCIIDGDKYVNAFRLQRNDGQRQRRRPIRKHGAISIIFTPDCVAREPQHRQTAPIRSHVEQGLFNYDNFIQNDSEY